MTYFDGMGRAGPGHASWVVWSWVPSLLFCCGSLRPRVPNGFMAARRFFYPGPFLTKRLRDGGTCGAVHGDCFREFLSIYRSYAQGRLVDFRSLFALGGLRCGEFTQEVCRFDPYYQVEKGTAGRVVSAFCELVPIGPANFFGSFED